MRNPCGYDGCMFMDVADDQKDARVAQGRLIAAAPALLKLAKNVAAYTYSEIAIDPEIWKELEADAKRLLKEIAG